MLLYVFLRYANKKKGVPILSFSNLINVYYNGCFFYKDTMCFSFKPKIQVKYRKEIQTCDFQYMNLDSRSEDL